MSHTYVLTPLAKSDHDDIIAYSVLHHGVDLTLELDLELARTMEDIAEHPQHGYRREELTEGLGDIRFRLVKKQFRIVYRADRTPVQILRILHGARDVRSKL